MGRTVRIPAGWRGLRWAAGLVAVIVALSWAVPAGATTTDLYPAGAPGYDVGYPNCTEVPPAGFAIVGLGGGRPFTASGCLASEWAAASGSSATPAPALYFNTGYAGAYARDITGTCTSYSGRALTGVPKHDQSTYRQAWEIGCSEADYAAGVAATDHAVPSMWWADIETGNSWSTNQTVNQFTVDGISYEMQHVAPGVAGAYSYPAAWNKVVGSGFTATPPFAGDWGPHLSCGTTGFSGVPVWVVQGATAASGVDTDSGCG